MLQNKETTAKVVKGISAHARPAWWVNQITIKWSKEGPIHSQRVSPWFTSIPNIIFMKKKHHHFPRKLSPDITSHLHFPKKWYGGIHLTHHHTTTQRHGHLHVRRSGPWSSATTAGSKPLYSTCHQAGGRPSVQWTPVEFGGNYSSSQLVKWHINTFKKTEINNIYIYIIIIICLESLSKKIYKVSLGRVICFLQRKVMN